MRSLLGPPNFSSSIRASSKDAFAATDVYKGLLEWFVPVNYPRKPGAGGMVRVRLLVMCFYFSGGCNFCGERKLSVTE